MIIGPNRQDFWSLPVYRALIPRLMDKPDQPLRYLQKEKIWIVSDKKIAIKEQQMGRIAELCVRLFREIHFFFNKSYQVEFYKAKDRIERTYEDSLRHEKTVRWVVEEKKEKFPEREKMASDQLKHSKRILRSGKHSLAAMQREARERLMPLETELERLNQQKGWWDAFQKDEDQADEAIENLNQVLPIILAYLKRGDCIRIYQALLESIQKCKAEIERIKAYYQNAIQQADRDIQEEEAKNAAITQIVRKIPKSPFKHRPEAPELIPVREGSPIRRLFDEEVDPASG